MLLPELDYEQGVVRTLVCLSRQPVLFIALTRPGSFWLSDLELVGMSAEKLLIIDSARGERALSNVITINNVADINDLNITITEAIKRFHPSFILLESAGVLSIYNDPDIVTRFIQAQMTKASNASAAFITVTLKSVIEQKYPSLGVFFDRVVEVPA